jgi:hypothetical protein
LQPEQSWVPLSLPDLSPRHRLPTPRRRLTGHRRVTGLTGRLPLMDRPQAIDTDPPPNASLTHQI